MSGWDAPIYFPETAPGHKSYNPEYDGPLADVKRMVGNDETWSVALSRAAEQLRNDRNRLVSDREGAASVASDQTLVQGEFRCNGAGGFVASVDFKNVVYTEKPVLVGFGAEARDWDPAVEGDLIATGMLPGATVVCVGYTVEDRVPGSRLYKGARLAVRTTGSPYQKLIVTWQFSGMALGGPRSYDPIRFLEDGLD